MSIIIEYEIKFQFKTIYEVNGMPLNCLKGADLKLVIRKLDILISCLLTLMGSPP